MKIDALRGALGRVLADVRIARERGQVEVAQRTGIDQSSLSKVEGGVNFPSWPTFLELCRAYRVNPAEMLTAAESLLEAKEGARVSTLEPDEHELLKLYRDCTAEGKRLMLDRAKAVRTLFPK